MTEFVEKRIGFADTYGTAATVNVADDTIQVEVGIGQCGATGYPTAVAARQLAAALLDAADQVEAKPE